MSTVLSLKMAAASWAGAAVDHSTAAAHRATRDIRSVRFMTPSSTPTLPTPRMRGWVASQEKEMRSIGLRTGSKRRSRGTGRDAGGRTSQNQQLPAPAAEFPAQAEKFPAAPEKIPCPARTGNSLQAV